MSRYHGGERHQVTSRTALRWPLNQLSLEWLYPLLVPFG
jgi:hypothetical protein